MADPVIDDPAVLAELRTVFARYETALTDNDVATLDALFLPAPQTVRYGVGETLYGFDEIAAFRRARTGGSPPREVVRTSISCFGQDFGTTHIEFQRVGERRIGRQTQSWLRTGAGWKIISAHVSLIADTA